MKKLSLVLILMGCISACSGPDADTQKPAAIDSSGEGPEAVARQIAATHAGMPADAAVIVAIEAVDFPNGGLGCPDPDMAYAAVITPGHKVEVQVGDETLDVRVSGTSGFVCKIDTKIPAKEPTA